MITVFQLIVNNMQLSVQKLFFFFLNLKSAESFVWGVGLGIELVEPCISARARRAPTFLRP